MGIVRNKDFERIRREVWAPDSPALIVRKDVVSLLNYIDDLLEDLEGKRDEREYLDIIVREKKEEINLLQSILKKLIISENELCMPEATGFIDDVDIQYKKGLESAKEYAKSIGIDFDEITNQAAERNGEIRKDKKTAKNEDFWKKDCFTCFGRIDEPGYMCPECGLTKPPSTDREFWEEQFTTFLHTHSDPNDNQSSLAIAARKFADAALTEREKRWS